MRLLPAALHLGRGYAAIGRVPRSIARGTGARPMSDDVVGFGFLAESNIPVWYLKPGETIFKEGETAKELAAIHLEVQVRAVHRIMEH